jgi:hypothetical protein
VEAGSNTSTVPLRVVGGDEKGDLESEAVNYCDSDTKVTVLARANFVTHSLVVTVNTALSLIYTIYRTPLHTN